jgi:hypothetical protein
LADYKIAATFSPFPLRIILTLCKSFLFWVLTAALFYLPLSAQSQTKSVKGEILDKQSDVPIPLASIRLILQGGGHVDRFH